MVLVTLSKIGMDLGSMWVGMAGNRWEPMVIEGLIDALNTVVTPIIWSPAILGSPEVIHSGYEN